jgi:hypothetical protein
MKERTMLRFRLFVITLLLFILSLALSACADEGSAPKAVENYLKAKIASDADKLVSNACKDYEQQALLDAPTFESVDARIEGLSCKETGQEGNFTLVTCEGRLIIQYEGEEPREQNLSDTTYLAIKENGEWKMCGEQQ